MFKEYANFNMENAYNIFYNNLETLKRMAKVMLITCLSITFITMSSTPEIKAYLTTDIAGTV